MTSFPSFAKSFWFSLFQTNDAAGRAGITRAIERDARSEGACIATQSATVAENISHEMSFLVGTEPYAVVRSRFYTALCMLAPLAVLIIASYQLTLFALETVPNEAIRAGAALALVGATLLAIHLLLDSLARSAWVMFVLTALSVAALANAHYKLAQARVAVMADWIVSGDRTVLESAVGPEIADPGLAPLTSTLLPLLEGLVPSIAVGLEVMAGATLYFALRAILDPALLSYWRLARLRRRAARLNARAVATSGLVERADEEALLTMDLGRGTKSVISREAVIALAIALVALLALSTNLFAAQPPANAGCANENHRVALLIDLSKSRASADVAADIAATSRILAEARGCSRYVVLGVTDDGWGAPLVLLDSTVTTSGGWMQQDLKTARKRLAAMWGRASKKLAPSYAGSDVLGTILYAVELAGISPTRPGTVVVFTDGRQTRGIDLESDSVAAADTSVQRAKGLGLVANITASRIFFFGVSTAGKSPAHWGMLRDFWGAWTSTTGASLGGYAIGRDVCAVTALCTSGAAPALTTRVSPPASVITRSPDRPTALAAGGNQRAAGCASFAGSIGSSAQWGAGWMELDAPTDFRRGETLRLAVAGLARKVVVRLLGRADDPNSPGGVDGGVRDVPSNGTIELTLTRDHRATRQISVHGGVNPWGLYRLGGGNGPAVLLSVERACAW